MDLKEQLQAMGAFVPQKLHKKEIEIARPVPLPQDEWADPEVPEYGDEIVKETITVFIRMGSAADDIELSAADKREKPFVAIYRFVCDEAGAPVFDSPQQAMTLKTWLVYPLFQAIAEVRGNAPKASRRKTSSGSKSR